MGFLADVVKSMVDRQVGFRDLLLKQAEELGQLRASFDMMTETQQAIRNELSGTPGEGLSLVDGVKALRWKYLEVCSRLNKAILASAPIVVSGGVSPEALEELKKTLPKGPVVDVPVKPVDPGDWRGWLKKMGREAFSPGSHVTVIAKHLQSALDTLDDYERQLDTYRASVNQLQLLLNRVEERNDSLTSVLQALASGQVTQNTALVQVALERAEKLGIKMGPLS